MILDFNKKKEEKELLDDLISAGEIMDRVEEEYYQSKLDEEDDANPHPKP